ncbi:unnamed protein product, partial [Mesorhabditis spiculigera]
MLPPEYSLDDPRLHRVETADPLTLLRLCKESITHFLHRHWQLHPGESLTSTFIAHVSSLAISSTAIYTVLALALLFTVLRYALQYAVGRWVHHHHVSPLVAHKISEAAWKLLYYGGIWAYVAGLHVDHLNTFRDPLIMWEGWESGKAPGYDMSVVVLYAIQTGFYVHSVWATLYMDQWRQDSIIMLLHHFVAVLLLALSYADNYTLAGALVFLLQDNSDALLEFAKLCVYLKRRTNGDYYPLVDITGKVFLQLFAIIWMIFRLYWYPCKLLYATIYGGVYLGPQDSPVFPIIGGLLLLLYVLNVFWFNFIARMCVRVLSTGEDPEDNREYDTTALSGKSVSQRLKEIKTRKGKRD